MSLEISKLCSDAKDLQNPSTSIHTDLEHTCINENTIKQNKHTKTLLKHTKTTTERNQRKKQNIIQDIFPLGCK